MIRLLSYIYPITRKVKSDYNGILEITWYNGKKHLNTRNANYSYGSLQKILKIGLQKIDLKRCKNILLLGLGGGSVIKTLYDDFDYQYSITAVDIDPIIITIAKDEFQVSENSLLKIICADALEFMQQNTSQYDLIIVDLFVDTEIPEPFFKTTFWIDISKATNKQGSILFNASLHSSNTNKLNVISNLLENNSFSVEQFEKINDTNTLLVAKSIN